MNDATSRILWWSFAASLLLYVAVAHLVAMPVEAGTALPALVAAFGVLAVAIGMGSLIYRRRALSGPIQQGTLDPRTPEGRQKALAPFIVNLALSESVGILGLVLALLSGRGAYSIPFGVAAFGLLYAHRPTAPDLLPPRTGSPVPVRPTPIG